MNNNTGKTEGVPVIVFVGVDVTVLTALTVGATAGAVKVANVAEVSAVTVDVL